MFGYNFVPLVTEELNLRCDLSILMLRHGAPGSLIQSGDIDNRLKTLFDALRMPSPNEGYSDRNPTSDETPFFCLLEDDSMLTKVSVETDQLLENISERFDQNDVRLVITVQIRPHVMSVVNIPFG